MFIEKESSITRPKSPRLSFSLPSRPSLTLFSRY